MPKQSAEKQRIMRLGLAFWVFLAGCGGPGSTDESTDGGMPAECAGLGSPFLDEDCLTALRSECGALESEQACASAQTRVFGDGAYVVRCGWAKVVSFADADACTVASVEGRCEAGLAQGGIGCGDPCDGEIDIYVSLRADAEQLELIEMPCAPGGVALDGPLGPWAAVGADPSTGIGICVDNVEPPAPQLCACYSVACEAG